jgi:hypothetical protein
MRGYSAVSFPTKPVAPYNTMSNSRGVAVTSFSYVKPLPVGKAVDGFVHRFGDG